MDILRTLDAYCNACQEVRPHAVRAEDPASCTCDGCGACQVLVVPLGEGRDLVAA